jgi:hypothetical protein
MAGVCGGFCSLALSLARAGESGEAMGDVGFDGLMQS